MATKQEYIDFICEEISKIGNVKSKKMFGEYMIYINDLPLIIVCDNVPYVKIAPIIEQFMTSSEKGFPYKGAKEHYVLDIENKELLETILPLLEESRINSKPKKKGCECYEYDSKKRS